MDKNTLFFIYLVNIYFINYQAYLLTLNGFIKLENCMA